jgi:hypothetical protein
MASSARPEGGTSCLQGDGTRSKGSRGEKAFLTLLCCRAGKVTWASGFAPLTEPCEEIRKWRSGANKASDSSGVFAF